MGKRKSSSKPPPKKKVSRYRQNQVATIFSAASSLVDQHMRMGARMRFSHDSMRYSELTDVFAPLTERSPSHSVHMPVL